MCNWVTMLYSRKLTEHSKPARMKKNKKTLHIKKKKKRVRDNMMVALPEHSHQEEKSPRLGHQQSQKRKGNERNATEKAEKKTLKL